MVLYGTEGIGKTTLAASAPKPLFIAAEHGSHHVDVARLPELQTWEDIKGSLLELTQEQHDFQTLVVDTLDWIEPILWAHLCKRDDKDSIEAFGFGKGYTAAVDEWRVFLAALQRLVDKKRINVVLLAHALVKPFKNPEGSDFDRYELALNKNAAGLFKQWPDLLGFANHENPHGIREGQREADPRRQQRRPHSPHKAHCRLRRQEPLRAPRDAAALMARPGGGHPSQPTRGPREAHAGDGRAG